jgi:hypothetical protein
MRAEHWSTGLLVGVLLAGLFGFAAVSGEHSGYAGDIRGTAAWVGLKHTAAARAGIPRAGEHLFELDHIVPCCLYRRCDNRLANLQMQPWPEAREKDELLERPTCRAFHAGEISEEAALSHFWREWP